jgi:P4 family phage/plasmid primase-like protien
VPPTEDGLKHPDTTDGKWAEYQETRPSVDELRLAYSTTRTGIGLVTGSISNNLGMIEIEGRAIREMVWARIKLGLEAEGLSALVNQIAEGCLVESPSGGFHLLYHCPDGVPGNKKLARRPSNPEELTAAQTIEDARALKTGTSPKLFKPEDVPQVWVETRGQHGYVVTAPSNGRVHPSGRPYKQLRGSLLTIATISGEEQESLFTFLRTFDQVPRPAYEPTRKIEGKSVWPRQSDLKPGEDYGQRGRWDELLTSNGWEFVRAATDGNRYWRRPGRTHGISASVSPDDKWLYVFTSSTVFDDERAYDKFGAYAYLEHGGDFRAAAAELRRLKYGAPPRRVRVGGGPGPGAPALPPPPVGTDTERDAEVVNRLRHSPNWRGFTRLMDGDASSYMGDLEGAAMMLLVYLAEFARVDNGRRDVEGNPATDADPEQMARIYRTSKLPEPDDLETLVLAAILWQEEENFGLPLGLAIQMERIEKGQDSRLWRYNGSIYVPDGTDYAAQCTRELLRADWARLSWPTVKSWFESRMPTISVQADREWINLPNTRLEWRTGRTADHSPDFYDTIQIPTIWRPGAKCPRFEKFLSEVVPWDAVGFIWELIGYLLIPDGSLQKAVLLFGTGGTGKGTLLYVIQQLVGYANYSTESLHSISDDRFASSSLYGKLVNVCGDLDARTVERSDTFKQLTGDDPINAQFKYGQKFSYVNWCRLMFSANTAPPTSDQTTSYFDRWLIVPMEQRFRGTPAENSNLRRELTTPDELEGILQNAIPALRRLMERGHFETEGSIAAAIQVYRETLDSVYGFQRDHLVFAPGTFAISANVYAKYQEWCAKNGRGPLSNQKLFARIRSDYPVTDGMDSNGYRGFRGAMLITI